ncbi:MAG: type II toxin-antitoxin system Phd/YefM family antitoxin [Spirochaetales bacterium]|nr:type II toxin-antitoxin system Phd/YefM family antitoxin [Spirochaetales bacterium]
MITANVHEAKTHLSEYLNMLEREGEIVLCRRNLPIARIVPILPVSAPFHRELGGAHLKVKLGEAFWDPLSDDLLSGFTGE